MDYLSVNETRNTYRGPRIIKNVTVKYKECGYTLSLHGDIWEYSDIRVFHHHGSCVDVYAVVDNDTVYPLKSATRLLEYNQCISYLRIHPMYERHTISVYMSEIFVDCDRKNADGSLRLLHAYAISMHGEKSVIIVPSDVEASIIDNMFVCGDIRIELV